MNDDHGANVALYLCELICGRGDDMKPMKLERHYTVQEVAEALRKDPSTIRRSIAAGEIPAVDVGEGRSSYRVAESDLAAYLDARRTTGPRA